MSSLESGMSNALDVVTSVLTPFDPTVWRWNDLLNIENFYWDLGYTPFSNIQIPIAFVTIYLISIYSLQNWMKARKEFVLYGVSLIHNAFLSLLSLAMFLGAAYGATKKANALGFYSGLVCQQDRDPIKGTLYYWAYIFYLSKFYELLDTYLLVLKKKPVIFLHVFHHTVMPFVVWSGLQGKWAMALWSSTFWNSFVHIVMYYYYFVATMGIQPHWKKYLTILQIYQFISGVMYTYVFFYYYFQDVKYVSDGFKTALSFTQGCAGDLRHIVFMFSVNNSFLYLFLSFFLKTYKPRGSRIPEKKGSETSEKKDQ